MHYLKQVMKWLVLFATVNVTWIVGKMIYVNDERASPQVMAVFMFIAILFIWCSFVLFEKEK